MGLLNYKTLLVLLFVVSFNVGVSVLLWQLDVFVHVDLYNYGLIFDYQWAGRIWRYNLACWTFILGATGFAVVAMAPHYLISNELKPHRFLLLASFIISAFALVFEGLSIFFLSQIDSIVGSLLYDFGIPSNFDWSLTYEPLIGTAYALTAISLVALMIPAVRSLGIVEIEIIEEDE